MKVGRGQLLYEYQLLDAHNTMWNVQCIGDKLIIGKFAVSQSYEPKSQNFD